MKSYNRVLTMYALVSLLHSDCPLQQASILGGRKMLEWVLDNTDTLPPLEDLPTKPDTTVQ
jgi:hypothetical protein